MDNTKRTQLPADIPEGGDFEWVWLRLQELRELSFAVARQCNTVDGQLWTFAACDLIHDAELALIDAARVEEVGA